MPASDYARLSFSTGLEIKATELTRTLTSHVGSARVYSPGKSYKLAPRHVRLAAHVAHTIAMFVLEKWESRMMVAST